MTQEQQQQSTPEVIGITRGSLVMLGVGAALLAGSLIAASTICYACMNPAFPS